MGFAPDRARGLLRVTLGRFNTEEEIERFLQILPQAVASLATTDSEPSYAFWD
jgi:cysteine sulfinate desulfinase/cysteine desulfurase-like protein